MVKDRIGAMDRVEAELKVQPTPARHPCPACGKETKKHQAGQRICSARDCRMVFDPAAVVVSSEVN